MRHFLIRAVVLALILFPGMGATQIVWLRFPASVFLDLGPEGSRGVSHVSHPSVVFDGDTYHLWHTMYNGSRRVINYARSANGVSWENSPGNPVLRNGRRRTWDGEFVSQPTVLHDGRRYRMWYTGYDGAQTRIGYATSSDGITWKKHPANPVLEGGGGDGWDAAGVSSPTVLHDGRRYRMWYTGYDGARTRIGYATSRDGVTWEKPVSGAVLEEGGSDEWDAAGVSSPTVLHDGRRYRMWYTGYEGARTRIGYTTSSDGITWGKPISGAVLEGGDSDEWDAAGVSSPTVVQTGNTYQLWYTGRNDEQMRIGYAFSQFPGDIDQDGRISVNDAILVLQYVAYLIDDFPIQALTAPKEVQTLSMYHVGLPRVQARSGQRIEVPMTIQDATGLYAGGLRVAYDPAVLQAVEVVPRRLLNGSFWQANTDLPGEVRCAFVSLDPLTTGGELFTLTFDVRPQAKAQETPLMLVEAAFNDGVPVSRKDGAVRMLPAVARLLPSYPNPFNPKTTIHYTLPAGSAVRLSLYDASGQMIRRLVEKEQPAGIHAVVWNGRGDDGRPVASGLYLCRLEAGGTRSTGKLLLLR